MTASDQLRAQIRDLVIQHTTASLDLSRDEILAVDVSTIARQNSYSSRAGGMCIVEYRGKNHRPLKQPLWIKKVDRPKAFFAELASVYGMLGDSGLESHITKPYWYDEDLGIVCIGWFAGQSLIKTTLRHALAGPKSTPDNIVELYRSLGEWMGRFHTVGESQESVDLESILAHLRAAVESDSALPSHEKETTVNSIDKLSHEPFTTISLKKVRTHNDFSLRNVLVDGDRFGIVDWDAMVHPDMPSQAPAWYELSYFLLNLQGLLRFHPLVSRRKIKLLRDSFIAGYLNNRPPYQAEYFEDLNFVFSLRHFCGIDSDRTLPQIYHRNLGSRYVRMLKKALLNGDADITHA